MKISEFLSEIFSVFGGETFYIFEEACFRNVKAACILCEVNYRIDR